MAGGTGQYVWALLEDWQVPVVPPDPEFRARKLGEAEAQGGAVLHAELRAIDPQRAAELDPRNLRRVIRALEISRFTVSPGFSGSPASAPAKARRRPVTAFILGLTMERARLYQRVDDRVDQMMEQGFLEEVKKLAEMGYQLGRRIATIGDLDQEDAARRGPIREGPGALGHPVTVLLVVDVVEQPAPGRNGELSDL